MTRDREHDPDAPAAAEPISEPISWEAIRKRAYELWERNHRPLGFEIEFWLLAERELRAERKARRSAEADQAPRRSDKSEGD